MNESRSKEYWTPPAGLTDTKDQVYHFLYKAMMKAYHEDRFEEAFKEADRLLLDPDLPLMLRVRCHMVLSTDDEVNYLSHAHRAVELLEKDVRKAVVEASFPEKTLKEAKGLLQEAETHAAQDARAEEEAEAAAEEVEEEEARNERQLSESDQLALKEASSLVAHSSRLGLPTPPASKGSSRRTTQEEGKGKAPSRRSSRLADKASLATAHTASTPVSGAAGAARARPSLAISTTPSTTSAGMVAPTPTTQISTALGAFGLDSGSSGNIGEQQEGRAAATESGGQDEFMADVAGGFGAGQEDALTAQDMLQDIVEEDADEEMQ